MFFFVSSEEEKRRKKREKEERRLERKKARERSKSIKKYSKYGIIISVILAIVGLIAWAAITGPSIGPAGSVHEHQDILAVVDGEQINFSLPEYAQKNNYIHFHGDPDPPVIHQHARDATLGYFFEALDMEIGDDFIVVQSGKTYRNQNDKEFKVYVNGDQISNPAEHILGSFDKILVYYGNDSEEEIENLIDQIPDDAIKVGRG
tara:strand:+ start:148 stop:762 length:615 start_codon:yes stop_codon:yes gene_type:complete